MGIESKIEWTQSTWNPWHGCHKVSAGCKNCYMFREKKHYGQDPNVVVRSKTKFYDPLKWKEPRTIFTCSWSDFFIEEADAWRDEAFAIMALTPQHTYQVLTKRPDRMLTYLKSPDRWQSIVFAVHSRVLNKLPPKRDRIFHSENFRLPLKNVWLGVSVEDQKTADERIPYLIQTPATIRWLSVEPLLGPVDLMRVSNTLPPWNEVANVLRRIPGIDWVVVGGESGANARPMHPDWARSLRDQCQAAGVPFFFKQNGEFLDIDTAIKLGFTNSYDGKYQPYTRIPETRLPFVRVGKKKAGRLLDGREWNEMPEPLR